MDRTVLEVDGPVATITFDQPARRNAMTLRMWSGLEAACAALASDEEPDSRVVVLTGAGDAFVAGADISQFAEARSHPEDQERYNAVVNGCYAAVAALPQPTIAKIRGSCAGGGVGIAVSADLRIAADDAVFMVPPARLGIGYPVDGVAALVHLVGPAWTKQLIYSGDPVDAPTALRIGLVNEVVPAGALDERVAELTTSIGERAPLSQRAAKVAVRAVYDPSLRSEADAWVNRCATSADYAEGIAAFMEKRRPRFGGT